MSDGNAEFSTDRELGMNRKVDRRDFLNGVAIGAAAFAAGSMRQDRPSYYPPTLNGMHGDHPGSFEAAHKLRDGEFWKTAEKPDDLDHVYDLVIVGGGISGLSAAHFYRAAKADARILILDNHDDFGGHAKRNEFHLRDRMELENGGTLLIDSPRPYSKVAGGLLTELGIHPAALAKACNKPEVYSMNYWSFRNNFHSARRAPSRD